MNSLSARLTLALAGLICIGISVCSGLLYMSHLAATGLFAEIAAPETSLERRSEIAQGLENGTSMQIRLVNLTWWLSFAALLLIAVVAMGGFRRSRVALNDRRP